MIVSMKFELVKWFDIVWGKFLVVGSSLGGRILYFNF